MDIYLTQSWFSLGSLLELTGNYKDVYFLYKKKTKYVIKKKKDFIKFTWNIDSLILLKPVFLLFDLQQQQQ